MRSIIVAAALAISTVGLTGVAHAQDFDLMQFADTDMDGKVTPAEYDAFTAQGWEFIGQGAAKVKVADVDPQMKPAFSGITPDAEGFVTKEAYIAAAPAKFKAADKNGDGSLDSKELNGTMAPPS